MADNGRLTVDQKVEVVLLYAETKSVVSTQRRFRAHFGTRWAPCKQTIYRLSLGTVFQPMRINSVPDLKCFCKNKNVLCVQSMVWHFVRHPVCSSDSLRTWWLQRMNINNVYACLKEYGFYFLGQVVAIVNCNNPKYSKFCVIHTVHFITFYILKNQQNGLIKIQ